MEVGGENACWSCWVLPSRAVIVGDNPCPSYTPNPSPPGGYFGDICNTDSECVKPRTCKGLSNEPCRQGEEDCECLTDAPKACGTSRDCAQGFEECRYFPIWEENACVSCNRLEAYDDKEFEDDVGGCERGPPAVNPPRSPKSPPPSPPTPAGPPTKSPGVTPTLFLGDACESSAQCVGNRRCTNISTEECSSNDGKCFCTDSNPDAECEDDFNKCYLEGEGCIMESSGLTSCFSCRRIKSDDDPTYRLLEGCGDFSLPSQTPNPAMVPDLGPGQGLNLEPCFSTSDCKAPRNCTVGTGPGSCTHPKQDPCESGGDCNEEGEGCFKIEDQNTCQSCKAAIGLQLGEIGDKCEKTDGAVLAGEPCKTSYDCKGKRFCLSPLGFKICRSSESGCKCFLSDASLECDVGDCLNDGEGCFERNGNQTNICYSCQAGQGEEGFGTKDLDCASPSPSPRPSLTSSPSVSPESSKPTSSPGDSPVCIAANMLTGVQRSDLVYAEHKRAQVLCDENGSCATDGHMVLYRGVAMMMATYCDLDAVNCRREATVVNSPRMRRGLRIASRTTGLEFTAFAARFVSKLEERALRGLVRFGL